MDELDRILADAHLRLAGLRLTDPSPARDIAMTVAEQTIDLLTPFTASHPHITPA